MATEVTFYDLPVVAVDLNGDLHIGIPGPKGDKGDPGEKGDKGDTGAAFVPMVDEEGILSWKNDGGLENPEAVDLKPLLEQAAHKDLAEIRQEIADLKYVEIKITSISNNVGTVEMGTTVDAVTVSWALNKEPVTQKVNGEEVEVTVRSKALTGLSVTTDTVFAVYVTDERDAWALEKTTVKFLNGVYYGALAYGGTIDSAAILGLTRKLQSGKAVDFTVIPGEGKRPVYACPTRYGTPAFKIGGFEYEWEKVSTFAFTNASGYTENYDVWMHGQDVSGSITVNVS